MPSFINKIIHALLKHYKAISLLLAVLYLASHIPLFLFFKVDTSLKTWFLENDPDYAAYIKFQDDYGSDELVTVLVDFETTVFEVNNLLKIKNAENGLLELPFVEKVLSVTSAEYYRSWGGGIKAIPVVKDISDSAKKNKKEFK